MRRILPILLVLLLAVAGGLYWVTRPLPVLTVTTWPGEYARAQAAALMRPYAAANRVDVRIGLWDGDLDDVRRAVKTGVYKGDVIDFELPKAVQACDEGLLEKIDPATLPPGADGKAAKDDFVPGAIGPCWVGSLVYSQMILFAPGKFATAPTHAADFFDLAHYPGPRALRRSSARLNLELALLADGVAPDAVYTTLATPAGLDRAFAKLDSLKGNLLWLDSASDAVPALQTGRAAFATALNGDYFAASRKGFTAGAIWDRQLYELDAFAIPKGDPRKKQAMDFIRAATATQALAQVASWVALGPARRSAFALVGNHPDLKIAMKPWTPTSHFATAFAVDDAWWTAHGADIAPRWHAFVAAH